MYWLNKEDARYIYTIAPGGCYSYAVGVAQRRVIFDQNRGGAMSWKVISGEDEQSAGRDAPWGKRCGGRSLK